jgi:uncharacterized cupredoxin-like copper-binding protein
MLIPLVVLLGCGDDNATVTGATGTQEQTGTVVRAAHVTIHESDFKLDPATPEAVPEGLVRITLVNDGSVAHALAVDGPNGRVDLDGELEPGRTGTLEVDLDKAGSYRMWCPLDGHRGKGMQGTITVTGTAPDETEGGAQTVTTSTGSTTPTQTQTQTQTETETKTVTKTETTPTTTNGY